MTVTRRRTRKTTCNICDVLDQQARWRSSFLRAYDTVWPTWFERSHLPYREQVTKRHVQYCS